ncbi:MAG: hypothetical protein ACODAC_11590 [Pseudomonadota bacterium]
MSDLNVDDFCKDAARALTALYAAFPRAHTLFVEEIAGAAEEDEFGLPSPRHMACLAALLWLADEGLLRYVDTIRHEAVDQAVLTARTFTLLSAPPPGYEPPDAEALPGTALQERRTRVNRLREALAERSSSRIRAAVMELLEALTDARPRGRTDCPDSR